MGSIVPDNLSYRCWEKKIGKAEEILQGKRLPDHVEWLLACLRRCWTASGTDRQQKYREDN